MTKTDCYIKLATKIIYNLFLIEWKTRKSSFHNQLSISIIIAHFVLNDYEISKFLVYVSGILLKTCHNSSFKVTKKY